MTPTPAERPTPLNELTFKRIRFREGYNMAEVDEFLRLAHHALDSEDGSVTAQDVHGARFSPVRLKEGYDMGQVDRELDRIATALEELAER